MTFGHSAAQIAVEPRRRGLWVVAATVGASILLGAALFGVVILRRADKDRSSGAQPPLVVQPVRKVHFEISSEPPGATVVRATDQRELGQTPWHSEQPAGSGPLLLILRRPGYADRIVALDQSANAIVKEALQPLVSAAVPPQPASAEVTQHPNHALKRGGKQHATAPAQPGGASAPAVTAQASSGTTSNSAQSSPAQPPASVKQSPVPPKEDTPHARIQMVD